MVFNANLNVNLGFLLLINNPFTLHPLHRMKGQTRGLPVVRSGVKLGALSAEEQFQRRSCNRCWQTERAAEAARLTTAKAAGVARHSRVCPRVKL